MAVEMVRGGGDRGSMERRKFKGFASSMGDVVAGGVVPVIAGGSTKVIEATKEFPESGQQDIAHSIITPMSWPQSM